MTYFSCLYHLSNFGQEVAILPEDTTEFQYGTAWPNYHEKRSAWVVVKRL